MPAVLHLVRATQCFSSGVPNFESINTGSCVPPYLCSSIPFLGECSQHNFCVVMSLPPAVLGKVSMDPIHKTVSSHRPLHASLPMPLKPFLSRLSPFCALMEVLQYFTQLLEVRCWVEDFLCNKNLCLVSKPMKTQALKRVSESAPPASCEPLLSSDREDVAILRILELQLSKLCQQVHQHFHILKSVLQKRPNLCFIFDAVFFHTVMLICIRVLASRFSARWHHTLFRFSLIFVSQQYSSHMHPSSP